MKNKKLFLALLCLPFVHAFGVQGEGNGQNSDKKIIESTYSRSGQCITDLSVNDLGQVKAVVLEAPFGQNNDGPCYPDAIKHFMKMGVLD